MRRRAHSLDCVLVGEVGELAEYGAYSKETSGCCPEMLPMQNGMRGKCQKGTFSRIVALPHYEWAIWRRLGRHQLAKLGHSVVNSRDSATVNRRACSMAIWRCWLKNRSRSHAGLQFLPYAGTLRKGIGCPIVSSPSAHCVCPARGIHIKLRGDGLLSLWVHNNGICQ